MRSELASWSIKLTPLIAGFFVAYVTLEFPQKSIALVSESSIYIIPIVGILFIGCYQVKNSISSLADKIRLPKLKEYRKRLRNVHYIKAMRRYWTLVIISILDIFFCNILGYISNFSYLHYLVSIIVGVNIWIIFDVIMFYGFTSIDISRMSEFIDVEIEKKKSRDNLIAKLKNDREASPLDVDKHLSSYSDVYVEDDSNI